MFLGLGWDRNPWGIYYYDGFAAKLALSKDPQALLPSARYTEVIRHEYFADVTDDPWLVTRMYARKALVALDIARHQALLGLALAALGLALLFDPFRRRQRAFVLLLTPALLLGLGDQVLVEPITAYGMGFTVAVGLLALLPLGFALAWLEGRIRGWSGRARLARRAAAPSGARDPRPGGSRGARDRRVYLVAGDLVGPAASRAQNASNLWQNQNKRTTRCDATETAPLPLAALRGTPVRTFDFAGGVPRAGSSSSRRRSPPARVGSPSKTHQLSGVAALISPSLKLPAGRYAVRLDGRLLVGGLTRRRCSATPTYTYVANSPFLGPCPAVPGTAMGLRDVQTTGEPVRLVLANFDPAQEGSSWVVRSLVITRQGG